MELTTAVHHGLPVWRTSLIHPRLAACAELCGDRGTRVSRREQLDVAMAEPFATDGPVLLCLEQDAQLL